MKEDLEVPDDDTPEPDPPDNEGLRNTKKTRDQVASPGSKGRRTREGGEGDRRTREESGK